MKRSFTLRILVLSCILLSLVLAGCSRELEKTKVVLTTGFAKDEIFRIEDASCKVPEMMVYLTNIQNRYENVYGEQIWDTEIDGVTLEENVKETALAKIAQVKAMNLLAEEYQLSLKEEELKLVEEAAEAYYASLNEKEIAAMDVDLKTIEKLYREYAIADTLYHFLIKDINPEISDDEARTITVEHILIKTYHIKQNGEKVEYTKYAKNEAKKTAYNVCRMAKEGTDFATLASKYSEDDNLSYSFGKGEKEPSFEEAAFNLGTGEISDVVETKFGYHIIKCISTFNREVTEQNKEKIIEERKKEVFGDEYDNFVSSLTKNLNEELWENLRFVKDDAISTCDFFEIYDHYFTDK